MFPVRTALKFVVGFPIYIQETLIAAGYADYHVDSLVDVVYVQEP